MLTIFILYSSCVKRELASVSLFLIFNRSPILPGPAPKLWSTRGGPPQCEDFCLPPHGGSHAACRAPVAPAVPWGKKKKEQAMKSFTLFAAHCSDNELLRWQIHPEIILCHAPLKVNSHQEKTPAKLKNDPLRLPLNLGTLFVMLMQVVMGGAVVSAHSKKVVCSILTRAFSVFCVHVLTWLCGFSPACSRSPKTSTLG